MLIFFVPFCCLSTDRPKFQFCLPQAYSTVKMVLSDWHMQCQFSFGTQQDTRIAIFWFMHFWSRSLRHQFFDGGGEGVVHFECLYPLDLSIVCVSSGLSWVHSLSRGTAVEALLLHCCGWLVVVRVKRSLCCHKRHEFRAKAMPVDARANVEKPEFNAPLPMSYTSPFLSNGNSVHCVHEGCTHSF